jgi:hypothetical protein
MTEAEWLACADTALMEQCLKGRATERKMRLFACACCRLLGSYLEHRAAIQAIDAAERYADGAATAEEVAAAALAARTAARRQTSEVWRVAIMATAWAAEDRLTAARACKCVRFVAKARGLPAWWPEQAGLLRDVFGNPFRQAALDPSCLAWDGGAAREIARGIYRERAFDRLPILHDALVGAGCNNEDILAHCRQPERHVRGCWVVDLLLGKV